MIVQISVSGGRTSAYMAYRMCQEQDKVAQFLGVDELDYVFVFANTGREHPDTLRFMNDVDRYMLGRQLHWLESKTYFGARKSSGYQKTSFDNAFTLDRFKEQDHPFHTTIRKYGIPNVNFQLCTRELKLNPMKAFMKDYVKGEQYKTAVGIRKDESRRVSARAEREGIFYPLVDIFPVDKQDVLDFWSQYEWDLAIPEWQGNCVTCHKKSYKKLQKVYEENPDVYQFNRYMESEYAFIGPEFVKHGVTRPRTFFRMNTSTAALINTFALTPHASKYINVLKDAGCSESCEPYPMEGDEFEDSEEATETADIEGRKG